MISKTHLLTSFAKLQLIGLKFPSLIFKLQAIRIVQLATSQFSPDLGTVWQQLVIVCMGAIRMMMASLRIPATKWFSLEIVKEQKKVQAVKLLKPCLLFGKANSWT